MVDMFLLAITIGMIASWMVDDLTWYYYVGKFINTDFFRQKPFNCTLCMSFWIGVVVYISIGEWGAVLLPPLASAAGSLVSIYKFGR